MLSFALSALTLVVALIGYGIIVALWGIVHALNNRRRI